MTNTDIPFNYDLERMKKALQGDTIRIPQGMRGETLKTYLREQLAKREQGTAPQ